MCDRCIYKRICKNVALELSKSAADTPCQRYRAIPPIPATDNEDLYVV